MSPKVSVLVPTYNRSAYLAKALNSILSQTYSDFEIIITDNCSLDDTEAVVASFSDDRIKYLRNEYNVGAVGNYNKALRVAKGEFIHLFSDDDIMADIDNLAFKVDILERYPNIGLVHSTIMTIDSNDKIVGGTWVVEDRNWNPIAKQDLLLGTQAYEILYNGWNFITMSTVMIRRSILVSNRIEFNNQLRYLIDWAMWLQISLFADFYYIDKPLVYYRRHNNNETNLMNGSILYAEILAMKISMLTLFPDKVEGLDIKKTLKGINKQLGEQDGLFGLLKKIKLFSIKIKNIAKYCLS